MQNITIKDKLGNPVMTIESTSDEPNVICKVNFNPTNFPKDDLDLSGLTFKHCQFNQVSITNSFIKNCKISNCGFNECEFVYVTGDGVTDIRFSTFTKCSVLRCQLNRAVILENIFDFCTLTECDFDYTSITNTIFNRCKMSGCFFRHTDIFSSVFPDCKLNGDDFQYACFSGSQNSFARSELTNCDFEMSTLYNVDFRNTKRTKCQFEYSHIVHCLFDEEDNYMLGEILSTPLIGWKICPTDILVELEIPEGAVVYGVDGDKFRTNKVKVNNITNIKTGEQVKSVSSEWDNDFIYMNGQDINFRNFDLNPTVVCSKGIHFFKTKEEALDYNERSICFNPSVQAYTNEINSKLTELINSNSTES